MSAHISDYVLMQDRYSFRLPIWLRTERLAVIDEAEKTLNFRLPPNAVLDEPSIIAFVADPSANIERIEYEIEQWSCVPYGEPWYGSQAWSMENCERRRS